jgi:hypothetical protein
MMLCCRSSFQVKWHTSHKRCRQNHPELEGRSLLIVLVLPLKKHYYSRCGRQNGISPTARTFKEPILEK